MKLATGSHLWVLDQSMGLASTAPGRVELRARDRVSWLFIKQAKHDIGSATISCAVADGGNCL